MDYQTLLDKQRLFITHIRQRISNSDRCLETSLSTIVRNEHHIRST